jgi:hypothetical protein
MFHVEQLSIRMDLPCSNPQLVEGWISIEEILAGNSSDFDSFDDCDEVWCVHAMDDKREDESYQILVEHFRKGGMINVPIYRMRDWDTPGKTIQSNGHHRVIAALDAGFTHVPYQTDRSAHTWYDDWANTVRPSDEY